MKKLLFLFSLLLMIGFTAESQQLFKGNLRIKGYLIVDDSTQTPRIILTSSSLPANARAGTIVLYNDTLRQKSSSGWLKIGGGGDPHITDSSIIVTYPTLGSNAFNVRLSPNVHGYMGVGYIQDGTDGGFTFFVDSSNFSWQGYSVLNSGASLGNIMFNGEYGLFDVTYKGGDTILMGDTIGIKISNEDLNLWDNNNVITKKYFNDRNYYVSDSARLRAAIIGYSGAFTNNTTSYIVVGDKTIDRSITIEYTVTRGTSYRTGRFDILNNGTTLYQSPDEFISDGTAGVNAAAIVFNVSYNGNQIRIAGVLDGSGNNAKVEYTIKKKLI